MGTPRISNKISGTHLTKQFCDNLNNLKEKNQK